MKNKYWRDRRLAIDKLQHKNSDKVQQRLIKEYEKALITIERRLDAFYGKYAYETNIDKHIAKRLLKGDDLKAFYLETDEFIKKSKENLINDKWEDELRYIRSKVRISRLESLEIQIKNEIEHLTSLEMKIGIDLIEKTIEDTYHRNIYLGQIQTGLGFRFDVLDTRSIEVIANMDWHEGNFSKRVWSNREKLITELRTELTQSFALGESREKAASRLSKTMGVAKRRSKTLIRTESALVSSVAKDKAFKEMKSDEYELSATLDERTSDICQSVDGMIFKLSERQQGITCEPFHANCRTVSIPVVKGSEELERIARNTNGNTYYVDGNMQYPEWHDKYVKSNPKELIGFEKHKNKYNDLIQYKEYKNLLGKDIPLTFDKFQSLKYNDSKEWANLKEFYKQKNNGWIPEHLSIKQWNNNLNNINWEAVGFAPKKLYKSHYLKHKDEFGIELSVDDYEKMAINLINKEISINIKGFTSSDGYIFRYDIKNNEFGLAKPDGVISTFFKPQDKLEYWEEQVRKYGK